MKVVFAIAFPVALTSALLSQTISKPSFQAASVKANPHAGGATSIRIAGNRYSATGIPLRLLITRLTTYSQRLYSILGLYLRRDARLGLESLSCCRFIAMRRASSAFWTTL